MHKPQDRNCKVRASDAVMIGGMVTARFFAAVLALAAVTHTQPSAPALLVLNKADATLVIVDLKTGAISGRILTGAGPHEVVASSDGATAFVANYGDGATPGNSLSMIDLAGKKELRRVDLGPLRRSHGLAFHDGKVYFTAEVNRLIGRYDPAANAVDWLLGTGQTITHMLVISKDGRRIFTANIGGNSISAIERGTNPLASNVTVIPVGAGPEAIDLSPDEREVWTGHSQDGGVSVIDVAAKKVVVTIDAQTKRSNRLKFTPDGKHVLISEVDAGNIVVINTATRAVEKRVPVGSQPLGILMPPDGGVAYIAVSGDNAIVLFDLAKMAVAGRWTSFAVPDGMAWAVRQ